jgi:O-antigen/teichoic acid export membrane protein
VIAPEQTLTARHSLPSALRNVLSNWAGFVCACIISFFLSPFVVRHLGNSAYGIWILIGSLTGYLGLLNMGVRAGVTVYVARFHAEANDQKASAVASTALAIFLAAATLVIAASFTLAALVVRLFHIPDGYQLAARVVLILAGLNVAISLISGVFGSILAARHRFDLSNLIEVANSVLSAIAIFFVLSAGKGLIALSLLNLFFGVAAGLAYTITAFRVYPTLKINPFYCDREHLRLIFSISVYAFLLQISFNLIFYTDSVVIGRFLSLSLITYFAIAGNLMNYSRALISGISTTLTPRASALEASGGREQVQKLLIKGTSLATVVMLPIAVTFLLRGSSFIRLWMGREYGDTSGRVLGILTLALFFIPANQVATSIMGGLEKYRSLALVFCCEALCNLVLSIVLARPMGIFGVAWGTTLPSLAVSLLFWPWYLHHALGIPTRKYLISTWLRPAVAMIPCSLLTYGIERLWPAPNLSVFFLQIGAILPFAALPAWYVSFERSDREAYSLKFVQPLFRTLGWN